MQDFRKLLIYSRAIEYCSDIYQFAKKLPQNEQYGLTSQIKRAACSIPLNISEGAGSISKKEFAQFLSYSYRSVNEVLTCLELIRKLNLIQNYETQISETKGRELSCMIYSFLKKLNPPFPQNL